MNHQLIRHQGHTESPYAKQEHTAGVADPPGASLDFTSEAVTSINGWSISLHERTVAQQIMCLPDKNELGVSNFQLTKN
jgi:hypothetical protein